MEVVLLCIFVQSATIGKKKKKKKNHQTNSILMFIPFITREFVVITQILLENKEDVKDLLFSASLAASNSQRRGNRSHSEYYIFIHTAIKRFVYGFAFSLNSHIVRLCYIVSSIMFFVHKRQNSADDFQKKLLLWLLLF